MASPKIGPSFFGKVNYDKYVSELITEGRIAGKNLSPSERREGFKKKGNKIQFESFVKKVLNKGAKTTESGSPSTSPIGYLSGGSGGGRGGRGNRSTSEPRGKVSTALTRIVNNTEEKPPEGLDDLLNDIRRGSPAAKPKIKRDDKVVENLRESNKNLLETNMILMDLTKSLKKDLVEDKKRAFKEKDRLRKEQRKAALASSGVSRTGSSSAMRRPRVGGSGLMDNPLMKFLGLSALAGLVEFIPKIIEFVESLPERLNKFLTKDVPKFIGEKFEELKSFVSGFFSDRFEEIKGFFEDVYNGIDEFTGGRLTEFIEGIKGLGPMIVEKSKEFYKTIDDWTGGRITGAFNWIGKNVIDPLGNFFKEKIDYVGTKAGELWSNFSSSFLNFFGDINFELPEFPDLGLLQPAEITGPDLSGDVVTMGDSIAVGVRGARGKSADTSMAREGAGTKEILGNIQKQGAAGNLQGKTLQLSSGISNTKGDTDTVREQLRAAKAGGATGVQLMGTANEGDYNQNALLQGIAQEEEFKDFVKFQGGFKAGGDKVHPESYSKLAESLSATRQGNIQQRQQSRQSGGGIVGTPEQMALLDSISFAEGTSKSYGTIFGGKVVPELEKGQLTIDQVHAMMMSGKLNGKDVGYATGGRFESVATGRYQFMPATLRDTQKNMKLPGDTLFTPEMQDKMILNRLSDYRGVTPELLKKEGLSTNVLDKLAPEFASFPYSPKGNKSYYGQPVKSPESIRQAFNSAIGARRKESPRTSTPNAQPATKDLLTTLDNVDAGVTDNAPGRKPVTASTPVTGQGSNPYGMVVTSEAMKQRSLGISSGMHMGVDIANGKEGAPLQAFTDGVITGNGTPGAGYGNWVSWTDTSGVEHFYAHMREKVPFNVGDKVKAGTKLGEVGNTGNSSGPHLHWETSTTPGDTGRPKGSKLSRFDPLSRYGFDAPFGGSTKPPENGTTKPKTSPAKVTPTPAKTPVSSVSETPSGSTANVSLVNLPPKVINNPAVISAMGGSGGESPAPIDVIPRVSTSTDEDIYNMHTRSIFNIVG